MSYARTLQRLSAEQMATIRHAGSILRDCLEHLRPLVVPGVSTLALDQAAEAFIRDHGGIPAFKGYHGFPGTLCTSRNDVVVHGIPSAEEILQDGDVVSLDCGVKLDGLYTDACITVPVGTVAGPVLDFLRTVSEALEDVVSSIVKAGVRVGDISAFIQERLQSHGYEPVRVLTGHGLGSDLHQFPDVPNIGTAGSGPELPAGAYIAIEPIAVMGSPDVFTDTDRWTIRTKDGSLACHVEHCLFVTEEGAEVLA